MFREVPIAFWGITATAVGFGVVLAGNETHFSWWSLFIFYAYTISKVIGISRWVVHFVTTTTSLVVAGVVWMSSMDCGTLREVGIKSPYRYLIGTFLMHYVPWMLTIADGRLGIGANPKLGASEWRLALVQATGAVAVLSLYLNTETPLAA